MDFWNSRPAKGILYDHRKPVKLQLQTEGRVCMQLEQCTQQCLRGKEHHLWETRKYQQLRIGGKRLHSTSHTTPQQQALGYKVRKFCILQREDLIVELQLPAITKKEQCKIFYFLTILHAENLRGCYVFTSLHSWRLAYSLQQIYFRGWVAQNIRLKNSFRVW